MIRKRFENDHETNRKRIEKGSKLIWKMTHKDFLRRVAGSHIFLLTKNIFYDQKMRAFFLIAQKNQKKA